jgi:hypothetical protein
MNRIWRDAASIRPTLNLTRMKRHNIYKLALTHITELPDFPPNGQIGNTARTLSVGGTI